MTTQNTKILIVEDEPVVKLHLKTCLEQIGYHVLPPVSSCYQALKSSKKETPNLVLMDIVLEGELDGIHAAEKITRDLGVPVVFLTAYSDEKTLNRARVCQPFGYIVKPFREEDLKSAIEIALFKFQQEKVLREHLSFNSSLLNSIEYPVMALNCDENIIFLSPKIQELLGKKEAQILGKGFGKVVKLFSENGERLDIPFDRILVTGEAEEFNGILIQVSKEIKRWVDITVSPFKKQSNIIIGSVLIFKDVTELSMTRQEKEKTLKFLAELVERKSESD